MRKPAYFPFKFDFEGGENPCSFDPTDIVAKNHNLFANITKDETKGGKKRKIPVHSLIMQMYI
jgi:hypothetical protein